MVMSCHTMTQGIMGNVVKRWEKEGRPPWTLEETIEIIEEVDAQLDQDGLGKSRNRKLHQHIEDGDKVYIKKWVLGCHFCWINPRNPPCPVCGME
jgi:hypothetical protein